MWGRSVLEGRPAGVRLRSRARARRGPADLLPRSLWAGLAPDVTTPVPKCFAEGSHRVEPVDRTLSRLLPRLGDFGITRIARITGFDRTGIETVTVTRPNARALSVANGKGLALASAKVSGIMEAIERWHGERPAIPLRFGDRDDNQAPLGLPTHTDLPSVAPVDRLGPIYWAGALDLVAGSPVLVPFETVHSCWLHARPPETPYYTSSNGLASGSHIVEAAVHAVCELIEHDACALLERLPGEARAARRIDLASIDDPEIVALLARLEAQEFAVALWDATTDFGAPVFVCALADTRSLRSPPGMGSGCHPSRAIAAGRAISEAGQTRVITLTGARDDLGSEQFSSGVALRFSWAVGQEGTVGRRPWSAAPDAHRDDLREDLRSLVSSIKDMGCGPALAIDLSREKGISVVRVLIPGLETTGSEAGLIPGPRAGRAMAILA
jgi:YcaO-like protein with predicted kinase domain